MVQQNPVDGTVVKRRKVSTNFCANILKVTVGEEKAKAAFSSISMGAIPKELTVPKSFSSSGIVKSHTQSEMNEIFNNKLVGFKDKIKDSE